MRGIRTKELSALEKKADDLGYDYAIFSSPMSFDDLRKTWTYSDFLKREVDFLLVDMDDNKFNLFRKAKDIGFIDQHGLHVVSMRRIARREY